MGMAEFLFLLSFFVFIGGVVKGRFLVLGLKTRWLTLVASLAMFAISILIAFVDSVIPQPQEKLNKSVNVGLGEKGNGLSGGDLSVDIEHLTQGMIIGKASEDDIYDIAFPDDMKPDIDTIKATGRSAQLISGIRIVKNQPIFMLKVVHFSVGGPIGVKKISATSLDDKAMHDFHSSAVIRQSIPIGTLEFATMVPFHEATSKNILRILCENKTCNVEVEGRGEYTTFSPSMIDQKHVIAMVDLYHELSRNAGNVTAIQNKALSYSDFLELLLGDFEIQLEQLNDLLPQA